MTPEQLEIAAQKLCELRGWRESQFNLSDARRIVTGEFKVPWSHVQEAIKYALEQP